MALEARDLKNDDTTDAGFDLAMDSIAALSADVAVTKIMLGAAGSNGGLLDYGQGAMAASISVVPASDITDATYIGDIKFGESLPTGTNTIGAVNIAASQTIAVTNAGTFAVQVDGAALTALQLIDDVIYVDDADWTATSSKHALTGGVYQSSPGTVTDGDTAPFRITVNGALHTAVQNTVTVSGTVTADLGATDNAVLDDIAAWTSNPVAYTHGAAVSAGSDKLVAIAAKREDTASIDVNVADGDFGYVKTNNVGAVYVAGNGTFTVSGSVSVTGTATVDNAGTFAVQVDGDALTAMQLIDDIVYVDDADWTATTSKHALVGGVYQSSPGSITDGDTGPLRLTVNGAAHVAVQNTVTVDGSGVTQPVSGTVTANLSATDNAVLDNIDTNTTDVPNVIGTDGAAGPSKAVSIAGTESGGNLQEIRVDSDGHPQVDIIAALPAGTNAIGKLAANDGVDIGDVTVNNTVTVADGLNIEGDVAHDGADSGNPLKLGAKAIAHGTNPTAVAANDRTHLYANRAGIPWVIGGHPNVITRTARVTDADGAQTNTAMITVAGGTKIVVTRISVTADDANTGATNVTAGFAAATLGADSHTGTNGILLDFQGVPAGGGVTIGDGSGIIGVGADGEDLRYTCEDPVGGSVSISVSYYTVPS